MNLFLHGIDSHIVLGDAIYEAPSSDRYDVILTNPPFGTKGANQAPDRDDFTIRTSNKQLNFVQHVLTILKPGGPGRGGAPRQLPLRRSGVPEKGTGTFDIEVLSRP
jgi:type I restriction-modification system DNA methylase subunit